MAANTLPSDLEASHLEEALIHEHDEDQQKAPSSSSAPAPGRIFSSFRPSRHARRRGLWTLLLLLALVTLATRLFSLPLNRAIELRYCRSYYEAHDPAVVPPDGNVPEELCKVKSVQQKLAGLQGVIETAVIGIDLAVTIPLGWVSDWYGRRLVLMLNAVGFAGMVGWTVIVGHLYGILPVEAMIAGPFFSLVGGHDCVLMSTIFAYVTDLTDDLVQRTSYIAYISSVNYVISLFGPSLASATMSRNIWLPFYISIGLLATALPTAYALPSTKSTPGHKVSQGDGLTAESDPLLRDLSEDDGQTQVSSSKRSLKEQLRRQLNSLAHLVIGRRNFQVLLLVFALAALASSNTHLLPQYMSKRYNWKFEDVGYLLSVKAAVNITLLALVIPTTMRILLRRMPPGSDVRLNYRGAQISLAVSIFGALFIATAPRIGELLAALIIYALGSALPVFTMSLVESAPVASDAHSSAQDYSVVMLTKTVGTLVGAPLMTVAWVGGIALGGMGLGLPYFVSAVLYLCAVGALGGLRLE